jgi:hypothetical protein
MFFSCQKPNLPKYISQKHIYISRPIKTNKEMIVMSKPKNIEVLDIDEDDEDGFTDGAVDIGKPIMTFSFAPTPQVEALASAAYKPEVSLRNTSLGKKFFNPRQRGATPVVDGEDFTLVRSYKLRPSTLKKLNEIKAKHQDVNVYLNTIVDEAISFYYAHLFSLSTKG